MKGGTKRAGLRAGMDVVLDPDALGVSYDTPETNGDDDRGFERHAPAAC